MNRAASLALCCAAGLCVPVALSGQTLTPFGGDGNASAGAAAGTAQAGTATASHTGTTTANPAGTPPLPQAAQKPTLTPLAMPKLSPGVLELIKLEGDFSDSVSKGGGKAFASWFAEDGVTLNNGQPAVLGRTAIAADASWDPAVYQLSWYAEGAQMSPANDAGFTWGHYDATTNNKDGRPLTLSGRYITFWKKVDGKWKVALDASANEPPVTP